MEDHMAGSVHVSLGTVQETLLIPLYGRAQLTREGGGLIADPKAVAIVDAIDYDFARFDGLPSLLGSVIRTRIFDHWVTEWLTTRPGGTLVELGSGLNTRFERVDDGHVHWIDLDLPDVIALRRRFFDDTERRRTIAASITEPSWIEAVHDSAPPWFFAIEAVLCFLPEAEVRRALGHIVEHFPNAIIAFDTWGQWILQHQHDHDALQKVDARVRWTCEYPTELATWGLDLQETLTLAEPPREIHTVLPTQTRDSLSALEADPQVQSYRLNRFRAGPTPRV
jgi:O-methyltransferase involved in polyketide biosynthesis